MYLKLVELHDDMVISDQLKCEELELGTIEVWLPEEIQLNDKIKIIVREVEIDTINADINLDDNCIESTVTCFCDVKLYHDKISDFDMFWYCSDDDQLSISDAVSFRFRLSY